MSDIEKSKDISKILRHLPSIDSLLREHASGSILPDRTRAGFLIISRQALDKTRERIINEERDLKYNSSNEQDLKNSLREEVLVEISRGASSAESKKLRHVINATGVVIHTNLGRSPLSEKARAAMVEKASRYCNLEYDLSTGQRGTRGARALDLLAYVTGAEAAIVVNNCAAATLLVLSSLAKGGETIISRGELVEIGGDFRVPEVMEMSGTVLREVGTTNRTKVSDYESAVNEKTKVILSVHSSNFKMIGFTSKPTTSDLADFARQKNLIFFEDAGSGALFGRDFKAMENEPNIVESIVSGVDVVSFSGDKLLGGLQSGIIVGKAHLIDKIRRNPMYRALRVDKLVYSCLEATLESFADGTEISDLPVLRMLSESKESLQSRCKTFIDEHLKNEQEYLEIIDEASVIGGGTTPGEYLPSVVIALKSENSTPNQIEERLRLSDVPVISRISNDKVLIDLRTVFSDEEGSLATAIKNAVRGSQS